MDLALLSGAMEIGTHLVTVAVALAVLALGARRPISYLLAALLLFFPVREVWNRLDTWVTDEVWSYNASVASIGLVFCFAFLQLAFLARAVDSPLTRPLRTRAANVALAAGTLLVFVLPFIFHESLYRTPRGGTGEWEPVGWLWFASPFAYILPALFGLVVAFDALRRAAPGSLGRRRARGYLAAFVCWDVGMILGSAYFLLIDRFGEAAPGMIALEFSYGSFFLAFPFLLARALLRDHLFDLDLKLKWTIRRGTLLGIFVAVFFIAAAIAEQWLSQYGVWFGGAAVGLMLLAIRPLERAANRLANAAMPGVEPTPAYVAHKKLEVYKAAVESAQETGGIDAREQAALDRLREKLGIAESDARAVERDVLVTTPS